MSLPKRQNPNPKGGSAISFLSLVLLPIFAFSLGWIVAESKMGNTTPPPAEFTDNDATVFSEKTVSSIDISLLREAVEIIQKKYIDPENIDPEKMRYGIVRGVVWSLEDPYSEFMTPKESEDFEHELDGDLEGIGAELTVRKGVVVVVSPLRDSPAENAGLLPEDIILEVDGGIASGEDFLNVINRIRGKKGTDVTLLIFRPETGEEKELIITRDQIKIETVQLEWKKEDIAVLEISQFGTDTEQEFNTALETAISNNAKGIILDLRFNSGGFLDTAVDVVSAFKKTGKVVIQKGRPPETKVIYTTGNAKTDLPLVVLQNRGSASASEIVSGAIQDLQRGIVMGDQSFGKGTVQEVIAMQNGAHLRITIAKWLTPNGRDIGKVGITPDILIERSIEDFENDYDPQMEAAIKFLNNELSVDEIKEQYGTKSEKEEASADTEEEEEESKTE
jgi:carboxyl-terminal processing protease